MGDTERYTTLACGHLGIAAAEVIKSRIEDAELVIIYGTGRKDKIPLDLLDEQVMQVEAPEDDENFAVVDATDAALRLMGKHGIDAADILDFMGEDKRITAPIVRAFIKGGQ